MLCSLRTLLWCFRYCEVKAPAIEEDSIAAPSVSIFPPHGSSAHTKKKSRKKKKTSTTTTANILFCTGIFTKLVWSRRQTQVGWFRRTLTHPGPCDKASAQLRQSWSTVDPLGQIAQIMIYLSIYSRLSRIVPHLPLWAVVQDLPYRAGLTQETCAINISRRLYTVPPPSNISYV